MHPDITIRITPWDRVIAYENLKAAAIRQRDMAQTSDDRLEAELWIDNAERNLAHWRKQVERETT